MNLELKYRLRAFLSGAVYGIFMALMLVGLVDFFHVKWSLSELYSLPLIIGFLQVFLINTKFLKKENLTELLSRPVQAGYYSMKLNLNLDYDKVLSNLESKSINSDWKLAYSSHTNDDSLANDENSSNIYSLVFSTKPSYYVMHGEYIIVQVSKSEDGLTLLNTCSGNIGSHSGMNGKRQKANLNEIKLYFYEQERIANGQLIGELL